LIENQLGKGEGKNQEKRENSPEYMKKVQSAKKGKYPVK